MNIDNNRAISTIAESVVTATKELLTKAEYDKTSVSTVVAEANKEGKYGVMYNGNIVYVPNYSGRDISINERVVVTLPSNNYKQMYISAVTRPLYNSDGSGDGGVEHLSNYEELSNKPRINGITLSGNKTLTELGIQPTKMSQLDNDAGYAKRSDIPTVPTNISAFTNDSGYITSIDIPNIPTKTSDLTNDSGFITAADIPSVSVNAARVPYSNTVSRLRATNVQEAIDEIASSGGGDSPVSGDSYMTKEEMVEFCELLVSKLGISD